MDKSGVHHAKGHSERRNEHIVSFQDFTLDKIAFRRVRPSTHPKTGVNPRPLSRAQLSVAKASKPNAKA